MQMLSSVRKFLQEKRTKGIFMLSKILMTTLTMIISFSSFALDYEHYWGGGLNIDTYKEDFPANLDLEDDLTLAPTLGYKGVILWGNVGFRTGVFAEYKKINVENSAAPAGEQDYELTAYYATVPLNLQINLNPKWSIYGGFMPRVLLAKTCEQCGTFDDDSKILANYSNLGFGFKMSRNWSMDINFQQALDDNFEDVKINTAQVLLFYEM